MLPSAEPDDCQSSVILPFGLPPGTPIVAIDEEDEEFEDVGSEVPPPTIDPIEDFDEDDFDDEFDDDFEEDFEEDDLDEETTDSDIPEVDDDFDE